MIGLDRFDTVTPSVLTMPNRCTSLRTVITVHKSVNKLSRFREATDVDRDDQ